jgi:hypothetical protein
MKELTNMMKALRFRFMVAALCVLLVTMVAQSRAADASPAPPARGHQFGRGGSGEFFADYLNLTDAQTAQMKGILAKENPALKPLFQQLQQTRQQLKQYEQGTYDDAKVRALAAQQSCGNGGTDGTADANSFRAVSGADRGPAGDHEVGASPPRGSYVASIVHAAPCGFCSGGTVTSDSACPISRVFCEKACLSEVEGRG